MRRGLLATTIIGCAVIASGVAADDVVTPPPRSARIKFDDTRTGDPDAIKELSFTYSPKVTYTATETVVAIATASQTHRNDHFGVTGEIAFSQSAVANLDVFFADGTRSTVPFANRIALPPKRVSRLVVRTEQYDRSWSVEWDLAPVPAPGRLSLSYHDAANPNGPSVVVVEYGRQYVVDVYRDGGGGDPPSVDVTIGEPTWSITLAAAKVSGRRNLYRTGPFIVYPRVPSPPR